MKRRPRKKVKLLKLKKGDQVIVNVDEGLTKGLVIKLHEKTVSVKLHNNGTKLIRYELLRKKR